MSLIYKNEINRCYEISKFKDRFDLFEKDGLRLPFMRDARNILIWMSGGADSALLTNILCQYIRLNQLPVKVHVLQFVRKWDKGPWQEKIGLSVYDYFTKKYPDIEFIRHGVLMPVCIEGTYIVNRNTMEKKYDDFAEIVAMNEISAFTTIKNSIDVNYNATTMNPPVKFNYRVLNRDLVCHGDDIDSGRLFGRYEPTPGFFANPFIFTDKSWIIKQYKDDDLFDLLNITRSCESYVDGIDFKNWDGNVDKLEDCNTECFWCYERNWALEVNGLLEFKDKTGKINPKG